VDGRQSHQRTRAETGVPGLTHVWAICIQADGEANAGKKRLKSKPTADMVTEHAATDFVKRARGEGAAAAAVASGTKVRVGAV
jgi:hypothetical protein